LLDPVHSEHLPCFTISSVKTHISGVITMCSSRVWWILGSMQTKDYKIGIFASLLSMQYKGIISINGCLTTSNMMGTTNGAGAAQPDFRWGLCSSIISFLCSVLEIIVCSFVLILSFFDLRLLISSLASSNFSY
jgi:hypothetical protein